MIPLVFALVSSLPCPQGKICLRIPAPLAARAALKARLADDLVLSLMNDEQNILDIKLEGEIATIEVQLLKGIK